MVPLIFIQKTATDAFPGKVLKKLYIILNQKSITTITENNNPRFSFKINTTLINKPITILITLLKLYSFIIVENNAVITLLFLFFCLFVVLWLLQTLSRGSFQSIERISRLIFTHTSCKVMSNLPNAFVVDSFSFRTNSYQRSNRIR